MPHQTYFTLNRHVRFPSQLSQANPVFSVRNRKAAQGETQRRKRVRILSPCGKRFEDGVEVDRKGSEVSEIVQYPSGMIVQPTAMQFQ